ncbi:MAG: hypothetical protein Q8O67_15365 [Deltaproteobacteria bacterium]|nr:hypothetical protein [Deltaproteobacteria bacterium]
MKTMKRSTPVANDDDEYSLRGAALLSLVDDLLHLRHTLRARGAPTILSKRSGAELQPIVVDNDERSLHNFFIGVCLLRTCS